MTSEEAFRDHLHPHVLPIDADPNGDDPIVPLEEYDYGPEWSDLVETVTGDRPEKVATDGGVVDVPDDDRDRDDGADVDETDQEADETDDVNEFVCPYSDCSADVTGQPDECPTCERPYYW